MKTARVSGSDWFSRKDYTCANNWPDDCFCQGGVNGIVFSKKGSYETAFFEAFPKNPSTFIRGEGNTVEEAEFDAWQQHQRHTNCVKHEFEKRGYTNGSGICKHCGLFMSDIFEPDEHCVICGSATYYTQDKNGDWYCEEHKNDIPEELIPEWQKHHKRIMKKLKLKKETKATCRE